MKHQQRPILVLLTIILSTLFFSGCSKKGGSNPAPKDTTPKITSLSVNSGPYTTNVTITGTGFSATLTGNKVFFNGVAAVVAEATSTQIYTSVPLAAGTGNVTVVVNGTTITGPTFTYVKADVVITIAGTGSGPGVVNGTGVNATFAEPDGIVADAAGNVYIADRDHNLIRKITPAGLVSTLAGSGQAGSSDGAGAAASFSVPQGIAIDHGGNLYVSDGAGSLIRKIDPSGVVSTLAGSGIGRVVNGTGKGAGFGYATGLAADAAGNVFVAENSAGQIRKITPAGVVTTFCQTGFQPDGLAIDKNGNIFATAGKQNAILKITPAGIATVFAGGSSVGGTYDGTGSAAGFDGPYGITIDPNGNLFVNDSRRIREITPNAVVTTFSGGEPDGFDGPVLHASFQSLFGITIDNSGIIYVVDNGRIKKITFQ